MIAAGPPPASAAPRPSAPEPFPLTGGAATIVAMTTLPIGDARDRLSALVEGAVSTHDKVTITRNGVPAAVLLSVDDYESLVETLAVLSDAATVAELREADQAVAAGDLTSGEEMAAIMARRLGRPAA